MVVELVYIQARLKKAKGNVHVYPINNELRSNSTHAGTIEHARTAVTNGNDCMGIKDISMFASIFSVDIIEGFPPDYMHAVCLSVTRQITELLLLSSSHEKVFYLGRNIAELNRRLCMQHPPNEITSCPRSLLQKRFWKASEWRTFCLLCSVQVLNGLLPASYLHHWMLLVTGLYLLMSDKLTEEMIGIAHKCFLKFVYLFPSLYGIENTSYNVHLLLHFGRAAKRWGQVQKFSAFIFEDACGKLLQLYHGTKQVQEQMARKFLQYKFLQNLTKCSAICENDDVLQDVFFKLNLQKARKWNKEHYIY